MKKPPPSAIRDYMTASPHFIGQEQTLQEAHAMMRTHDIRHLPVLHGGTLVGIVSQRDLALVESLPDVDPRKVTVEDAMSTETYCVPADAPLVMVATEMADRKLGSAVVLDGDRVVGVFTLVDVCRALARVSTFFISATA